MKNNITKNITKYLKSQGVNENSLNSYKKKVKNFTPMIITESSSNMSAISVFDKLMEDRIIFLGEEIDDFIANVINAQLLYLTNETEKDEPIWLYINSPGGDCYSGLAIQNVMEAIETEVYTTVMGKACSMAFVLAVSGEKGHRYSLPHSRFLMHQPLGGLGGFNQASDIAIYNKEIQDIKQDLADIIALKTEVNKDIILQDMDRDFWMNAKKAQEYGCIDKIITKL